MLQRISAIIIPASKSSSARKIIVTRPAISSPAAPITRLISSPVWSWTRGLQLPPRRTALPSSARRSAPLLIPLPQRLLQLPTAQTNLRRPRRRRALFRPQTWHLFAVGRARRPAGRRRRRRRPFRRRRRPTVPEQSCRKHKNHRIFFSGGSGGGGSGGGRGRLSTPATSVEVAAGAGGVK